MTERSGALTSEARFAAPCRSCRTPADPHPGWFRRNATRRCSAARTPTWGGRRRDESGDLATYDTRVASLGGAADFGANGNRFGWWVHQRTSGDLKRSCRNRPSRRSSGRRSICAPNTFIVYRRKLVDAEGPVYVLGRLSGEHSLGLCCSGHAVNNCADRADISNIALVCKASKPASCHQC